MLSKLSKMTATLPSSITGSKRKGFALIDPETNLFYQKLGRSQHVAISYCWAEWTDGLDADHNLQHWPELRRRLLKIVGPGASQFMKIRSGGAIRCWIDCKCIDQGSAADKSYWIPRMDEVYSEARCTVLLMRKVNLAPLQEAPANQ
jgi:Heterokaryon incompatibility protein (HET)